MSFASRPAHTLEDAVSGYAEAITNFNPRGEGIVAVELDGQQQRLLAILAPDDRNGEPVAAGATLFIRSIDPRKQRCVVSRAIRTDWKQ
jgi:hypothetical protein